MRTVRNENSLYKKKTDNRKKIKCQIKEIRFGEEKLNGSISATGLGPRDKTL